MNDSMSAMNALVWDVVRDIPNPQDKQKEESECIAKTYGSEVKRLLEICRDRIKKSPSCDLKIEIGKNFSDESVKYATDYLVYKGWAVSLTGCGEKYTLQLSENCWAPDRNDRSPFDL